MNRPRLINRYDNHRRAFSPIINHDKMTAEGPYNHVCGIFGSHVVDKFLYLLTIKYSGPLLREIESGPLGVV